MFSRLSIDDANPGGLVPGRWNNTCVGEAMDFEGLANEHKDAVYRQMLRVCGNREDAEDVLVEALLRDIGTWTSLSIPKLFVRGLGALAAVSAGN